MPSKSYFVYIMASTTRVLYAGSVDRLEQRVWKHKNGVGERFTARYGVTRLVWFGETNDAREMVQMVRRIKGWTRAKKIALIESLNPAGDDLAADWSGPGHLKRSFVEDSSG